MALSHPLIVIQSICTSWTKVSRGGVNASARNHTPEVLVLPMPASPCPDDVFLLHTVLYSETNLFQQPIQRLEQKVQTNPFRYDCLNCLLTENTLDMTIEWEQSKGVPRRPAFLRKGFSLQEHQWGRVIYNLRLSGEDHWAYEKRVLNIGFFAQFSPTLFLETEPVHTYRDIARLW
jgi:hypothetical protein